MFILLPCCRSWWSWQAYLPSSRLSFIFSSDTIIFLNLMTIVRVAERVLQDDGIEEGNAGMEEWNWRRDKLGRRKRILPQSSYHELSLLKAPSTHCWNWNGYFNRVLWTKDSKSRGEKTSTNQSLQRIVSEPCTVESDEVNHMELRLVVSSFVDRLHFILLKIMSERIKVITSLWFQHCSP